MQTVLSAVSKNPEDFPSFVYDPSIHAPNSAPFTSYN